MNDGEPGGGVSDLEVADVGAIELEGLAPGGAGDAGHLEVDGDEVRGADVAPEIHQRGFEVGGGYRLQGKRRCGGAECT